MESDTTNTYDPSADRGEFLTVMNYLASGGRTRIPTDELSRRLVWSSIRVHAVLHALQNEGKARIDFDGVRAWAELVPDAG